MKKRTEKVGDRLLHFVRSGGFTGSGALDFGKAGAYSFEFEENGSCKTIRHCLDGTVTPESHAPVSNKFQLMDNHLDGHAVLVLPPRRESVHGFFGPNADFKQAMHVPGKKCSVLKDLTAELKKAEDRILDAKTSSAKSLPSVLEPGAKKRAREASDRVKTHLKVVAEKRQRSRFVSFNSTAAASTAAGSG